MTPFCLANAVLSLGLVLLPARPTAAMDAIPRLQTVRVRVQPQIMLTVKVEETTVEAIKHALGSSFKQDETVLCSPGAPLDSRELGDTDVLPRPATVGKDDALLLDTRFLKVVDISTGRSLSWGYCGQSTVGDLAARHPEHEILSPISNERDILDTSIRVSNLAFDLAESVPICPKKPSSLHVMSVQVADRLRRIAVQPGRTTVREAGQILSAIGLSPWQAAFCNPDGTEAAPEQTLPLPVDKDSSAMSPARLVIVNDHRGFAICAKTDGKSLRQRLLMAYHIPKSMWGGVRIPNILPSQLYANITVEGLSPDHLPADGPVARSRLRQILLAVVLILLVVGLGAIGWAFIFSEQRAWWLSGE